MTISEKVLEKAKLEIGKKLLDKGFSMEDAVEITGLSTEQIEGNFFTETVGGLLVKDSGKQKPRAAVHDIYDKLFKLTAEKYPREIIDFALRDRLKCDIEIIGITPQDVVELKNTEIDTCFRIRIDGTEYMVNVEPYDKWRPHIPESVFVRNAFLRAKYGIPIITLVYILEGSHPRSEYSVIIDGNVLIKFEYITVGLNGNLSGFTAYKSLVPFLLKAAKNRKEEAIEPIVNLLKDDPFLKAVTYLILTHTGMDAEEVSKMLDVRQSEMTETLFEIPLLRDYLGKKLEESHKQLVREREDSQKQLVREREDSHKKQEVSQKQLVRNLKDAIETVLWVKFKGEGFKLYEQKIRNSNDLARLNDIKEIVKIASDLNEVREALT